MPDTSPRLGLPYLQASQAQKHVTHNEALKRLDTLTQLVVAAFGAETPPTAPEPGEIHALGALPTGAWAGQAGMLAAWDGAAWSFVAPRPGWRAWGLAEAGLRVFDGTGWIAADGDHQGLDGVGIGTAWDAVNRLAVASDASLFNHDGAGHRVKVNKAAAADTASLLFQSGFSGRAEIGLSGDDDLHVKVSPDGSAWTEAVVVDGGSGSVGLGISPEAGFGLTVDGGIMTRRTGTTLTSEQRVGGAYVIDRAVVSSDVYWHCAYAQSKRSRGTTDAQTAVQAGDALFAYDWYGHDGAAFVRCAQVQATVDAAPEAGIVPTYIKFTTMDAAGTLGERMRITSGGNVGLGVEAPSVRLAVDGCVRTRVYTVATLPAADIAGSGARAFVSDAAVPTFGAVATGGGTHKVPVHSDGSTWKIG